MTSRWKKPARTIHKWTNKDPNPTETTIISDAWAFDHKTASQGRRSSVYTYSYAWRYDTYSFQIISGFEFHSGLILFWIMRGYRRILKGGIEYSCYFLLLFNERCTTLAQVSIASWHKYAIPIVSVYYTQNNPAAGSQKATKLFA